MKLREPFIFNITKGSFTDGEGLRTVVFLKGCPLRCIWCHNPESQELRQEYFYFKNLCKKCGECQSGCNFLAKVGIGTYYTPKELADIILSDLEFYHASDGGVTFSGGEPLLFTDYLSEVITIIKKEKVHTCFETSGYFDFKKFKKNLLDKTDTILFEFKLFDPLKHRRFTGKSNEVILKNFIELCSTDISIIPRITLVPSITATRENLYSIALFLKEHDIKKYELLSYHTSFLHKYEALDKPFSDELAKKNLDRNEETELRDYFSWLMNEWKNPSHV